MTYKVGDKVRVTNSPNEDLVPNGAEGTVTLVVEEDKFFVELPTVDTPNDPALMLAVGLFGWPVESAEIELVA